MSTTLNTLVRPAAPADRSALTTIVRDYELRVFGGASEPDEQAALIDGAGPIHLAEVGGRPAALLRRVSDEQIDLLAGPDSAAATVELLGWAADEFGETKIRVPESDRQLLDSLETAERWQRHHASFDVFRETALALPAIRLDDTVRVEKMPDAPDLDALHQLIYHDAAWAASGAGYHEDRAAWRVPLAGHDLGGAVATDTRTGQLVGAIVAWPDGPDLMWMHRVAVATDQRGRGIGGGLLHRALSDARAAGFSWLGVSTHATNVQALALYDKWSFDTKQQYLIWTATAS